MASFAWLLPSLIKGSGGHRTILECARALEARGHHCALYIENGGVHAAPNAAAQVQALFDCHFKSVKFGWQQIEPTDVAVATVWYSAAVVRDLSFQCKKLYFVQDWEAGFNPIGDAYLMAENSYLYGLVPITIGRWLPMELQKRFSLHSYFIDFGANLEIYGPRPEIRQELAVCFIYQPEKPRRCPRLGLESLGILKHHRPNVKIYLYGSKLRTNSSVWFEHEHLGLLSLEECNRLYARCQIGLCISASNPSRIPFEMMASGLPVVDLHRENTIYDFPASAMLLSQPMPENLAGSMIRLLDDPQLCRQMGGAGTMFMADRPLQREAEQFCIAAEAVLAGKAPSPLQSVTTYQPTGILTHHYLAELPPHLRDRPFFARSLIHKLPSPLRRMLIALVRRIRSSL